MSEQIAVTKDLIAAVEKSINDLKGQGAEFESIRNRLTATYAKLQGLLAMLERDAE